MGKGGHRLKIPPLIASVPVQARPPAPFNLLILLKIIKQLLTRVSCAIWE